jgi:hypothetical protein
LPRRFFFGRTVILEVVLLLRLLCFSTVIKLALGLFITRRRKIAVHNFTFLGCGKGIGRRLRAPELAFLSLFALSARLLFSRFLILVETAFRLWRLEGVVVRGRVLFVLQVGGLLLATAVFPCTCPLIVVIEELDRV